MKSRRAVGLLIVFAVGVVTGHFLLRGTVEPRFMNEASAQQQSAELPTISPTKALATRDIYFPGTEDLKPDEMRITALGTGMPSARPKQAAACFPRRA